MPYRFATAAQDYTDYASGRVFYSAPGRPVLPVRLILEIFQRCRAQLKRQGITQPSVIYDPCCGSAYHLSTLPFFHGDEIEAIIGSDIDADILKTAAGNLSLLTTSGIDHRLAQIKALYAQFEKESHADALTSGQRLKEIVVRSQTAKPIQTNLFQADATQPDALQGRLPSKPIDIVLADVPYGNKAAWINREGNEDDVGNPLQQMLGSLAEIASPHTVVTIISDKKQLADHPAFKRLERFQIGHRRIMLFKID
ncbi:MAG: hypothetical protein AAF633_18195 [Chloroflexota bacterium]